MSDTFDPVDPEFLLDIFPKIVPGPSLDASCNRLEKDATHYRMDHGRRGVAAIFYQKGCDSKRDSVANDVNSLSKTFSRLGFDVETFKNVTTCELDFALQELSLRDHSGYDSIVVVYLCKGTGGKVTAKDGSFNVNCLWSCFTAEKSPTLANKPKLFIVQVYELTRGRRGGRSRDVTCANDIENNEPDRAKSYFIPDRADFLIVLSNVQGMVYSKRQLGSLYVQTLCQHLDCSGTSKDIMTILTEVNCQVLSMANDTEFTSCDSCKKHLPTIISLLIRILQFSNKKKGSHDGRKVLSVRRSSEEEVSDLEEDSTIYNCVKKKKNFVPDTPLKKKPKFSSTDLKFITK